MYPTNFARFSVQGIQNVQEAIEAILDAQFTKLPDPAQTEAYRKIYIHLVKNQAPYDLVREVSEWSKKETLRRDEVRTSQLLGRLRAGIRSIDEKAGVSNKAEVDELSGRTEVPTPAKEEPKERARPTSIPEITWPVLWTKLDLPGARVGLIRRATERQENFESLVRSEQRHATFLAGTLEEWMASGSPKDVLCCRSLLSAVQKTQDNQDLQTLFWEELDHRASIRSQLREALAKDEEGILSQARRDVLVDIVCGLLKYLTQPLSEIQGPLPPGGSRRELLPPEAAKPRQLSWDRGRSVAESFLKRAQYPLSLSSQKLNSVVMEAMQDDLNLLGETLRSVAAEAAASNRDWPFVRSFWVTLDGELEKSGRRGMLKPFVDLLATHEKKRRGAHFQSSARRA